MSCSACPSLPVVTVAGKTLLEVSVGETAVALSAVSDTWCDGTGREGEGRSTISAPYCVAHCWINCSPFKGLLDVVRLRAWPEEDVGARLFRHW